MVCILINESCLKTRGKAKATRGQAVTSNTPLIPGFGRQSQTGLCEFKATLDYTRSMYKQIQMVMAHTFNPSPRGNIKWEEREA